MKSVTAAGISLALLASLLASALDATPAAAPVRTAVDVSKLGPQVGERVPDFALKDQTGKVWTRQSIMGPKGAMLVFYRSADWCPYCKTELIDLQSRVKDLQAHGLGLAAISYDPVSVLADFAARRAITFPLLSDAGSATIKAYGILNPVRKKRSAPIKTIPPSRRRFRSSCRSCGRPQPWSASPSPAPSSSIARDGSRQDSSKSRTSSETLSRAS